LASISSAWAHFAQHRYRHEIHDENIGAKSVQLLRPQVGHDDADQEGDERDDWYGGDARLIDVPHERRGPQRPRPGERLVEDADDAAEEADHRARLGALKYGPSPQFAHRPFQTGRKGGGPRSVPIRLELFQQFQIVGRITRVADVEGPGADHAQAHQQCPRRANPRRLGPRPIADQRAVQRVGQAVELRLDLRHCRQ
jgi:hypothetical protein